MIEPPPLTPLEDVVVHGDWILWPKQDLNKQRKVALPADFYLRELMGLDHEEVDLWAVAEIVRTFGLFCSLGFDDVRDPVASRLLKLRSEPNGPEGRGHNRTVIAARLREAQRAVRILDASRRPGGLETLVEPDVSIGLLNQINEDGNEWPATLDDLRSLLVQNCEQELEEIVNSALSRFSVGIGDLVTRRPTVYSVAFLQIYNHICERAVVRTCANESCQQSFVRQRGRAQYGQHRTEGVKYCTRECARAQAQRELRRRRRPSG